MNRRLKLGGDRRLIAVFCLMGVLATGVYVAYLAETSSHWQQRNVKVETFLDHLCPFAILTAVFIDIPDATASDSAVLWIIISILNAGLYGVIGAALMKLAKRSLRQSERVGWMALLAALIIGMVVGTPIFLSLAIGFGCLMAARLYYLWSLDAVKPQGEAVKK